LPENTNTEIRRFFGEKDQLRTGGEGMTRVRTTAVLLATCAALLIGASAAMAASPRQIYNDYVTHGRFTHTYSQADMQRALHSTLLQGYTHGHHINGYTHGQPPPPPPTTGGLPFTGMDLGLITFGAVLLLAFGAGLRRFARSKA
jgi:hypothetical protein